MKFSKKLLACVSALALLVVMLTSFGVFSVAEIDNSKVLYDDLNRDTLNNAIYGTNPGVFTESAGDNAIKVTKNGEIGWAASNPNAESLGYDWTGWSFYVKTSGAMAITPYLYCYSGHGGCDTMYAANGTVTLVAANGTTSSVAANGGAIRLTKSFEGWVIIGKDVLMDAWGKGSSAVNFNAYSMAHLLFSFSGIDAGEEVVIDDLYWMTGDLTIDPNPGQGGSTPDPDPNPGQGDGDEPNKVVYDDLNGDSLSASRYAANGTGEHITEAAGDKAIKITANGSYGFWAANPNAESVGYDWTGWAFYVKTTGAVSVTPNLDNTFTHGGNDRLFVPTGAVTLVAANGATSQLNTGAGGSVDFTEAFEGWVIIDKTKLTDAWGGAFAATNYNAKSMAQLMFYVANMGAGVELVIDDLYWMTGELTIEPDQGGSTPDPDPNPGQGGGEPDPDPNPGQLPTTLVIEDFEKASMSKGVYGGAAPTLLANPNGGKWMSLDNNVDFATEVQPDYGPEWDGVAFYLKTTGAIKFTPMLYSGSTRGGIDTMIIQSGGDYVLYDLQGRPTRIKNVGGALDVPGAFEGWVVMSDADLRDAWSKGANPKDHVSTATISEILFEVSASDPGIEAYVDDILWIFDMAAYTNQMDTVKEPSLIVTKHPVSALVQPGESVTLSVEAVASYDGAVKYQWQKSTDNGLSWTDIENATAAVYMVNAVQQADHGIRFRCVISSNTLTVNSNEARISLPAKEENGKLTLQDFGNMSDVDVDEANDATLTDPIFMKQYHGFLNPNTSQWEFNGIERVENADGTYSAKVTWNGNENWTSPSNVYVKFDNRAPANTKAIAIRLTLPGSSSETAQNAASAHFSTLFVDTPAGTFSAYLNYTWNGRTMVATAAPGYESNPVSVQKVDMITGEKSVVVLNELAGQGANILFTNGGFDGWVILPLDYWMSETNMGEVLPNDSWVGDAAGVKYDSIDPTKLNCIQLSMGNSDDGYETIYHEIAAITDIDAFLATMVSDVTIDKQPEDVITESGKTATFQVEASAQGAMSYQWQVSADGKLWTDIEGATAATYTTAALTAEQHLYQFRCIVRAEGSELPACSDAANLYVDKYPDVVIDHEIDSDPIDAKVFAENKGKNVDIIINVQDYGETVYSWKFNGKDITDAVDFAPEVELGDVYDIGLDETAPDALYFTTAADKLPGKGTLTMDTSWNFFENTDLILYRVDEDGKLYFNKDGFVAGVSTTLIPLSKGGSWLVNGEVIDEAITEDPEADKPSIEDGENPENPETPEDSTSPVTGDTGYVWIALALLVAAAVAVIVLKKKANA